MNSIPIELVKKFQSKSDSVRNACIVAHVDHGKTTISDFLVASNGIISLSNAGESRYLDSRPDEQVRGITLKTSVISILYDTSLSKLPSTLTSKCAENQTKGHGKFVVNFLDSPGHSDFSGEVSEAVELADSAFVVVDVVEGVCVQTEVVIRQALKAKLELILVLNKIDKLFTELALDCHQAYDLLFKIIENANAVIGDNRMTEDMEQTTNLNSEQTENENSADMYFDPLKGNVIFCSALDQWAFNLIQMANFYSPRFRLSNKKFLKILWGDYFCDFKNKIIKTKPFSVFTSPVFSSVVLSSIWKIYDKILIKKNKEAFKKIAKTLDIPLPKNLHVITKNERKTLRFLLSKWLPISDALLGVLVKMPDPKQCFYKRFELSKNVSEKFSESSIFNISDLAFGRIYKVKWARNIDIQYSEYVDEDSSIIFIGLGKLFSGKLNNGDKIYFFAEDQTFVASGDVKLFIMMSSTFYPVEEICEGNVFAMSIPKNIDLKKFCFFSNKQIKVPTTLFRSIMKENPILKVAVTPISHSDNSSLEKALQELCLSDSTAVYTKEQNEQLFLYISGEMHFEKCKKDLEEVFAKETEFTFSKPHVEFKETIVPMKGKPQSETICVGGEFCLNLRALPINPEIRRKSNIKDLNKNIPEVERAFNVTSVESIFCDNSNLNLLILSTNTAKNESSAVFPQLLKEFCSAAFLKACSAGPVCNEPLCNVAFLINFFTLRDAPKNNKCSINNIDVNIAELSSSVILKAMNNVLRKNPLRLMQPFYKVMITCEKSDMKNLATILSRHSGKIKKDFIRGTSTFVIEASIPVYTYGDFIKETFKCSKVKVIPKTVFNQSKIQLIDEDPFLNNDRTDEDLYIEKNSYVAKIIKEIREVKGLQN